MLSGRHPTVSYSDPSLPSFSTVSELIFAIPGLFGYFDANPAYCEYDSATNQGTRWINRVSGEDDFIQAGSGVDEINHGPVLTANAWGRNTALRFTSASAHQMTYGGSFPIGENSVTKIVFGVIKTHTGRRNILSSQNVNGRSQLYTNGTVIAQALDGAGDADPVSISAADAYWDAPAVIIADYDHTTDTNGIRINGSTATGTDADIAITQPVLHLGGQDTTFDTDEMADMDVFKVLLINNAILSNSDYSDHLNNILAIARSLYGIDTTT